LQLNLFFYALAMLCGLASVAFGTLDPTWRGQGVMALGLAVGAIATRLSRLTDPVWMGILVAGLAILAILRPRTRTVVAACGGALAGLWASMLQLGGLPWPAALVIAAGAPALSAFFTRRKAAFAPPALQDEALVIVVVLALWWRSRRGLSEVGSPLWC
jgi:hypothetical protein